MDDKIEKIKAISSDESTDEAIQEKGSLTNIEVNKDHFESLILQERNKEAVVASTQSVDAGGKKPTLMEEVRNLNQKVDQVTRATHKDLADQANGLVAQIDELKTKLATPNLELKSSVQNLLRNKLTHIDESLKIALSKAGVEYKPPTKVTGVETPIERFLGYLTDAQYQLGNLGNEVQSLANKKGGLSPAAMLAIQIKVGYVSQEIEFFTSLLNKALESTKTIMNVQV
jgi:NADH dehydrogenase/NADH:ubiquinone oxidoreductase subunit G